MGQYLQPTPQHLPVDRWVTPEEFAAAQARRARRSASRTSRPDRSCGRATTRASSCGVPSQRASAPEERRSRPVSRILCAGCPAGDHLSRPRSTRDGDPFAGSLRSTRKLGRAALERFLLDLAPDGGYRAAAVARRAGGLLPHRCTLTADVAVGGGFLSVAPSRGRPRLARASVLPCGVRTFLERPSLTARGRPAGSSAATVPVTGDPRPASASTPRFARRSAAAFALARDVLEVDPREPAHQRRAPARCSGCRCGAFTR